VCTREAAVYVGQAASRLVPCGLLLDVGNPDGEHVPCVTDAGGRDGVVRLLVDPSAEVDAVTEAVWGALEELRCLRSGTAAANPVGAP